VPDELQRLGRDGVGPDVALLTRLVYELLDAHVDTTELAAEFEDDLDWTLHLDYLRALQRQSREVLACVGHAEAE